MTIVSSTLPQYVCNLTPPVCLKSLPSSDCSYSYSLQNFSKCFFYSEKNTFFYPALFPPRYTAHSVPTLQLLLTTSFSKEMPYSVRVLGVWKAQKAEICPSIISSSFYTLRGRATPLFLSL